MIRSFLVIFSHLKSRVSVLHKNRIKITQWYLGLNHIWWCNAPQPMHSKNSICPLVWQHCEMLDIWYWYISIWNTGHVDISANGSGSRIFLLHKISFLATGYRIWIYIHLKSVDLDMILYPKKVDMTHSCHFLKT